MKILAIVRGTPIQLLDDGSVSFGPVGLTVDADGSPRAYGPPGTKPLDYLANAGNPGNWWGIETNDQGRPIVQGADDPAPGYYVSTTSYRRPGFRKGDPRAYLDSEQVCFIVVPAFLRKLVKPVVLGCAAEVIDTHNGNCGLPAIVGDFGPATHLGEASIRVAREFGIHADPKRGGIDAPRFIYKFFPGRKAEGFDLQPA